MNDTAQTQTSNQIFNQIAEKIILQQETIIGPVAIEQAKRVSQLKLNWQEHKVDMTGDPQTAINQLVEQYKQLFGQIAVETCKDAVQTMLAGLPSEKVPSTLK